MLERLGSRTSMLQNPTAKVIFVIWIIIAIILWLLVPGWLMTDAFRLALEYLRGLHEFFLPFFYVPDVYSG